MLGSILSLALLAETSASLMDGPGLKKVMIEAAETQAPERLATRRFRIVLPFIEGRQRKFKAFQHPARWTYDGKRGVLVISIGFGEITPQNYDEFEEQKLDLAPPLQTFFFEIESNERSILLSRSTRDGEIYDTGVKTKAYSYGLAVPYREGGVSNLPPGFKPLMVSQIKIPRSLARTFARDLSLVVEGEVTHIGQQDVFCGRYSGWINAKDVTGDLGFTISDKQCFVPAKIDLVRIVQGGNDVAAQWPKTKVAHP